MRILKMFNVDSHKSEFYFSDIFNEYVHVLSFDTSFCNVSITSVIHCSHYIARLHKDTEQLPKRGASFDDTNLESLLERIKYMIDNENIMEIPPRNI